jgi:hypothetical protein
VEVGLAIIGALLIGLPLVAVLGVRRLPPPRRRAVRPDPLYELSRRHRLSGSDLLRVQDAVAKGRAVDEQRLRPAAAAYAQLVLRQYERKHLPSWLTRSRWRYVAAALYVGLVVAVVVKAPGAVGGFVWAVLAPLLWREQRRKAQLALSANTQAAASPEFDIIDGG